MEASWEPIEWSETRVRCPECGNTGHPGAWEKHADVPFRITEQVARMWSFVPTRAVGGPVVLLIDGDSESVDWESGSGLRLLCMSCLSEFEIGDDLKVDFG